MKLIGLWGYDLKEDMTYVESQISNIFKQLEYRCTDVQFNDLVIHLLPF